MRRRVGLPGAEASQSLAEHHAPVVVLLAIALQERMDLAIAGHVDRELQRAAARQRHVEHVGPLTALALEHDDRGGVATGSHVPALLRGADRGAPGDEHRARGLVDVLEGSTCAGERRPPTACRVRSGGTPGSPSTVIRSNA